MALFGKKKNEAQPSAGNPKGNLIIKDKKVYIAAREKIERFSAINMMNMALAHGDLVDADKEGGLDYEWFSPKPGEFQDWSLAELTMYKVAAEYQFKDEQDLQEFLSSVIIKTYYHPEEKSRIVVQDMEFLVTQFIRK